MSRVLRKVTIYSPTTALELDIIIYIHILNLPHVSALLGHPQGGSQRGKIKEWLLMSQICNGEVEI
jgi:hypothetical protein